MTSSGLAMIHASVSSPGIISGSAKGKSTTLAAIRSHHDGNGIREVAVAKLGELRPEGGSGGCPEQEQPGRVRRLKRESGGVSTMASDGARTKLTISASRIGSGFVSGAMTAAGRSLHSDASMVLTAKTRRVRSASLCRCRSCRDLLADWHPESAARE